MWVRPKHRNHMENVRIFEYLRRFEIYLIKTLKLTGLKTNLTY